MTRKELGLFAQFSLHNPNVDITPEKRIKNRPKEFRKATNPQLRKRSINKELSGLDFVNRFCIDDFRKY